MSQKPPVNWKVAVRYAPHHEMTEEERQQARAFFDWFNQLENFILSRGTEQTGVANTSSLAKRYLWIEGVNSILTEEEGPDFLTDSLLGMPAFPKVWSEGTIPDNWIKDSLNELRALEALHFPVAKHEQLARVLREQAIRILTRSREFAPL